MTPDVGAEETMTDNPYFQNVVSELISLLILVGAGYTLYRLTGRRRLLSFFHVGPPKRFITYLSRITVVSGGSVGVDGQPRAYAGPTFALNEAELIGPIQRLFNYVTPGLENLPGFLRFLLISDVTTQFSPSPDSPSEVENQAPFLALGSPAYNAASKRIEDAFNPLGRFDLKNWGTEIQNLGLMTDANIGFLQRAIHPSSGQVAYYAAGPACVGTTGAAIYLIRNWRELQKRYGDDKPFLILLRFRSPDPAQYEVVVEKRQ